MLPRRARGRALRRLLRSDRGAMALTVSQMFLGAVSLGIAMFRGTEVNAALHHETTLAHANWGGSKLAMDHARSANVVVNDNVTMGAIMGPRFGVEADNITMDGNAQIACPTCPSSPICTVCQQYQQNKPRALTKLIWVRAKQQLLWGTLGSLSGKIDSLAFQQAQGIITSDVAKIDSKVSMRFSDPSSGGEIWGAGNSDVACNLAMKDVLPSPVTGHAFQVPLIKPNLLEGLPKILVQAMPKIICQASGGMGGGGGGGGGGSSDGPQLPQIKDVADQTKADCANLQSQMNAAVAAASGNSGGAGIGTEATIADVGTGNVQLPSAVQPFVTCQSASTSSPLQTNGGGFFFRSGGCLTTCTFDSAKCQDQKLTDNSQSYLQKAVGLPPVVSNLAQSLGGSETRKPTEGGSNPKDFCACAYASKPVDETMINISDAVRQIASFGTSQPSQALRKQRDYRACGRWYFPAKKGEFASTPEDEQPFVAAWKWNQTTKCQEGGQ